MEGDLRLFLSEIVVKLDSWGSVELDVNNYTKPNSTYQTSILDVGA